MSEKPTRPIPPGPQASEAEFRRYAEENAACSIWDAEHPDDLVPPLEGPLPGEVPVT